ncbi:hypothetical protein CEXT_45391 [Caerostris extrusa]|uniref:Uncharacterized protein n=1 Tax=Caerostris extrusa TaxID=172846 RepID=A0AAV4VLL3_CAEEX|nr:hypothetical protein CEXT_45391 [Caerostris extrusa]
MSANEKGSVTVDGTPLPSYQLLIRGRTVYPSASGLPLSDIERGGGRKEEKTRKRKILKKEKKIGCSSCIDGRRCGSSCPNHITSVGTERSTLTNLRCIVRILADSSVVWLEIGHCTILK